MGQRSVQSGPGGPLCNSAGALALGPAQASRRLAPCWFSWGVLRDMRCCQICIFAHCCCIHRMCTWFFVFEAPNMCVCVCVCEHCLMLPACSTYINWVCACLSDFPFFFERSPVATLSMLDHLCDLIRWTHLRGAPCAVRALCEK